MIDAYTTSSNYPYAQQADTERAAARAAASTTAFNYVRNSVKAVVDAYDGIDHLLRDARRRGPDGEVQPDPIVGAYRKAFPDLFADFEDMPEDLQEHIRYPEDLFRVQTNMWGRYHISESTPFYEQAGALGGGPGPGHHARGRREHAGHQRPGRGDRAPASARIEPYYLQMQLPGEERRRVHPAAAVRAVVDQRPTSSQLTAFMVAQSDPEDYGKIKVYTMPGTRVDGPAVVQANIAATDSISQRVSLLNQQGSQVRFGNLLLIPVDQTILYVRPMYVQARGDTAVPELKNVIVAFGAEVAMGDTLLDALTQIFDTDEDVAALEQILAGELNPPTDPDEGPDEPDEDTPAESVETLLADASRLLDEADAALNAEDGPDLGLYQEKVDEARAKLAQVLELEGLAPAEPAPEGEGTDGSGGTTTTAPPTTSPPPATSARARRRAARPRYERTAANRRFSTSHVTV